ncbi:MAG: LysM peptidoglycan-binding domain-containing protein [Paludibacter sp.]|nr:LysM peptidoglycan-binding domain-containing protein [Paludibacter sp.]
MQEVNYQLTFMSLQKQLFILISVVFSIVTSGAQKRLEITPLSVSDTLKIKKPTYPQISLTDSIVNYGKLFLNTPYHYGSSGTDTFDCSGFTSFVYRNFGFDLLRSSAEQARQFSSVDRQQIKIGDLVFFSGRRRSSRVGHVGIVTNTKDNGQFEFIHAAVHSGVTISNSEEPYYTRRFIKANRVISSDPFLAVLPPSFSNIHPPAIELNPSTPFASAVIHTRKFIPAEYHRVKSGETLSSIAHKYGISITDLKRKNHLKGSTIQPKQHLKIKNEETIMLVEPAKAIVSSSVTAIKDSKIKQEFAKSDSTTLVTNTKQTPLTHIVKKGETLFSISRLYNVSIDELKKINQLKNAGIQPNQKLKISNDNVFADNSKHDSNEKSAKIGSEKPNEGENRSGISKVNNISDAGLSKIKPIEDKGSQKKLSQNRTDSVVNTLSSKKEAITKNIIHKVKSGESLFSISKKYNISIDELKKINRLDGNNIRPGQELSINQVTKETIITAAKADNNPTKIVHKVKSGDTYISIAKTYACTVKNLKEWNNKTGSKIKTGEKLIVYSKAN